MITLAESAQTVTLLLRAWRAGDRDALNALIPLVYDQLNELAAGFLRGERPGHTFRPTELVSEAYLRLGGVEVQQWTDRVHFFSIAARTMRQVLVDHARRRSAAKRGGGVRPVTLDEVSAVSTEPHDLLALDAALRALAEEDERKARVVELHYFGGLSQAEIATALEVHVNTVASDLRFAQAWLQRAMA